ncbi:hypothetical protein BDV12DRAFT_179398 [Aspergillus spectabilis]
MITTQQILLLTLSFFGLVSAGHLTTTCKDFKITDRTYFGAFCEKENHEHGDETEMDDKFVDSEIDLASCLPAQCESCSWRYCYIEFCIPYSPELDCIVTCVADYEDHFILSES